MWQRGRKEAGEQQCSNYIRKFSKPFGQFGIKKAARAFIPCGLQVPYMDGTLWGYIAVSMAFTFSDMARPSAFPASCFVAVPITLPIS